MDKTLILLITGVGIAVAVWIVLRNRDHYVSSTYTASCSQLCGIAHPHTFSVCDENRDLPECKSYSDCMNQCRADQSKIKAQIVADDNGWDGPYGKLI